ncbi:zonular occludens toxin domain-containing protein [Diaphorobacter nitroreducens]|uniref:zonular occludens toxin domain-containing protein n=1 Tax=Diaphorobacter nitroreducens TaxID=164759 RepID=UPI0028A93525|nr:zonular occludens toxin domain-containing protein [Diaphorobacter nitroreducens]
MINGLEGIPRSGKSYEAVAFHVLPMLQQGRKVITNLPLLVDQFAAIDPSYRDLIELRTRPGKVLGTWDPDRIDDKGNGNAFELFKEGEGQPRNPAEGVAVFGHVWDYYSTWKHPKTGRGPVFIIDEAHVALPDMGTDKQVVQWFKLHGHFNADVLLITQSFRDINQAIARLMAMIVICRKADILGKEGSYIRKVKAGYRGAVISTEERAYKPQYFGLYRSHTQGNSVAESAASDVKPMLPKLKLFTRIWWAFALAVTAWAFWPESKPVVKTSDMEWYKELKQLPPGGTLPAHAGGVLRAAQAEPVELVKDASQVVQPVADDEVPEPYASKGLHLTGRITYGSDVVYTFAVSASNARIATLDSRDLIAMGYKWQPLTDCAGVLRWGKKAQAITCDAPALATGAADKPLVYEVPQGGGAPTGSSHGPVRSVPMPQPAEPQAGQITQAEITPALRLRNPLYSGPAG